MPDEFADAIRELIQAKVEHRAPEVAIAPEGKPAPQVINIMAALKKSMEARDRPRFETRCGSGWESSQKRRPDRDLHGPDRAPPHGALVVSQRNRLCNGAPHSRIVAPLEDNLRQRLLKPLSSSGPHSGRPIELRV